MTVLATAIAFARRGHPVLPLTWPINIKGKLRCSCRRGVDCPSPAKHPYGRHAPNGLLSASTDEATIRKWFGDEPAANLGVVTDGLIVIDVDPRHEGDSSLAELERNHNFPPAWLSLTGGGGQHLIYRCPEGVTVNSSTAASKPLLGPGVDVRARGGYIVAPPSRHMSGRTYEWSVDHHPAEVEIAEAPAWLLERLTARKSSDNSLRSDFTWALDKTGLVSEYRDMAVASVAGKLLRARSLDPEFVATLVLDWNARHCSPPLPDREVAAILDRIARREIARLETSHA